ncbi:oligogalacturonate-specific porin KdgM family protein [Citrobacter koseri]|uniref:oligogalacturonate-specific porin KdgM family protein n=1 Tax=Citrobacter koseri TaxID=545 RepID=UPI001E4F84E2|nr:oligogalacturonate-specific porin KdgM family protein [Citrobacter koseri]
MSMSKKCLFTGAVIFLSFTPFVHAVQFDVRGGYNIENHSYESRFKVSNSWSSGWWASMETDSNNGSPSLDDMTSSYNEMETNYTWHINDRFALVPGGVIHWSNSGTQLRPYIRLNYKISERFSSGIRYRLDHHNYDVVDNTGDTIHDNEHRIDLFLGYKINQDWNFMWQGTAYMHQDPDLEYNNGKRWATENAFTIKYRWNEYFSPYFEYDYLDEQSNYKGENGKPDSRIRVGVTFNL